MADGGLRIFILTSFDLHWRQAISGVLGTIVKRFV
jgi:hypothetical protein